LARACCTLQSLRIRRTTIIIGTRRNVDAASAIAARAAGINAFGIANQNLERLRVEYYDAHKSR
jgi:hypothetical protein